MESPRASLAFVEMAVGLILMLVAMTINVGRFFGSLLFARLASFSFTKHECHSQASFSPRHSEIAGYVVESVLVLTLPPLLMRNSLSPTFSLIAMVHGAYTWKDSHWISVGCPGRTASPLLFCRKRLLGSLFFCRVVRKHHPCASTKIK